LPRAINQDCLEIFFSSVRSHNRHNALPDVAHFVISFKSLLINNFFSRHSTGANCEKDFTVGALDNLRSFLTGEVIAGVSRLEPDVEVVLPDLPLHCKKSQVAKATLAYLAGYIAKTLLKKHSTCTTCREVLLRTIEVIEARNFNQNRFLTQPGSFLYYVTSEACTRLVYLISRYCKYETIHKILESILVKFENFTPSNCIEHNDLGHLTAVLLIKTIVNFWTRHVNLVIAGKDQNFLYLTKHAPNKNLLDPVKLEAHEKYVKRRHLKKKTLIVRFFIYFIIVYNPILVLLPINYMTVCQVG
jgi:hypothetical protein